MENDKSIDVLNSLITINNDRIEGYKTAIEETEDQDLITMFNHCMETSQECKSELVAEVNGLGGEPEDGTRIDGKIYRAWMDFKSLLTGKDRKAILNSCEYGEDVAVHTYERAMKDADLSSAHNSIVSAQYAKIKADHDKVRNMRDAAVEA
ncbi:MAG: PA2169 family four-helix-bundle protein [Bacteroidota bacterium]|nr:PA2169 family four-helix-bundle protein [Bacteroidota bacterium]